MGSKLVLLFLALALQEITTSVNVEETVTDDFVNGPVVGPSRVKRWSLRSADPLTRRSSLEKNFIRFGRSGNKHVRKLASGEDDDDKGSNYAERGINKRDVYRISRNDAKNLLRFGRSGRQNANGILLSTKLEETVKEDDKGENLTRLLLPQATGSQARFFRYLREPDSRFPRSRLWRKSDNFIRYGRKDVDLEEKPVGHSTDEFEQETFYRPSRKNANFMRYGRINAKDDDDENPDKINYVGESDFSSAIRSGPTFTRWRQRAKNEGNDQFPKNSGELIRFKPDYGKHKRRRENFIRWGRSINDEQTAEADNSATSEDNFSKTFRMRDNFIGLGGDKEREREYVNYLLSNENEKYRPDIVGSYFTRSDLNSDADHKLSPRSDNYLRFGRNSGVENLSFENASVDRSLIEFEAERPPRKQQNYLRFGRDSADEMVRSDRRADNYLRFGRKANLSAEEDLMTKEFAFESERPRRKQQNYLRFGRDQLSDAKMEPNEDWTVERSVRRPQNYLRFGRDYEEQNLLDKYKPILSERPRRKQQNYLRFGRSKVDNTPLGYDYDFWTPDDLDRSIRKTENYLRFGKNLKNIAETDSNHIQLDFTPEPRRRNQQQHYLRFGRGDEFNYKLSPVPRSANYIRFGRNEIHPTGDGVETPERPRRKQQNYLRFGRNYIDGKEELLSDVLERSIRRSAGKYLRFGRTPNANGVSAQQEGSTAEEFPTKWNRPPRKHDNYLRFGRNLFHGVAKPEGTDSDEVPSDDNFQPKQRKGRFLRFGKNAPGYGEDEIDRQTLEMGKIGVELIGSNETAEEGVDGRYKRELQDAGKTQKNFIYSPDKRSKLKPEKFSPDGMMQLKISPPATTILNFPNNVATWGNMLVNPFAFQNFMSYMMPDISRILATDHDSKCSKETTTHLKSRNKIA